MKQDRALALLMRHFPGAVETVDSSSAGRGITVDVAGQLWPDRCDCPRHPHQGHAASPRHRRSA